MKKNLETLKALVKADALQSLKLRLSGVQAYNIEEGCEYNVIVEFAIINGRYYFIDRDGKKFLASRYERAEWLAGEFNEQADRDTATAQELVSKVKKYGAVWVFSCLLPLFFDVCDVEGVEVESKAAGETEDGVIITLYELKSKSSKELDVNGCVAAFLAKGTVTINENIKAEFENALTVLNEPYEIVDGALTDEGEIYCYAHPDEDEDNSRKGFAPVEIETAEEAAEETAADVETVEAEDERKPSALSALIAKVSSKAKKYAVNAAFVLSLLVVFALVLATVCGMIVYVLTPVMEALNPVVWFRVVLACGCMVTIVLDAACFVLMNSLAALAKVFPEKFYAGDKPCFSWPRNMIYWTIKESM